MKALKYILLISLFIQGCKKPYDDPPVQAGISNIVVECTLTNEPPPYIVYLTKSVPYNSKSNSSKVSNAKISILDDAGNIENLIEKPTGAGIYRTSANGMQGQVGRSYKLKIALTDGKTYNPKIVSTYESDWVKINEPPTIDSIYAENGQMQSLLQQPDGTYYIKTVDGLNMYIDAKPSSNQDYYYKFKSSMIQEYTQIFYTDTVFGRNAIPPPAPYTTLYGWFKNNINIDKNLRAGTAEYLVPIRKYFIGFVPEFVSTYTDTFHDSPVSVGVITTTTIYSVQKKLYRIFTEENSQTKPANSIFDPIPTQLESNIKCTSDTTKSVLGYFNAASVVYGYHFFLLTLSHKIYSHKIDFLPSYIDPTGVDTSAPPNFWHTIYDRYK